MRWLIGVAIAPLVLVGGITILTAMTPLIERRRQRHLRRCLRDVTDILNAHGIDYWCDYGTLLGYFRDGDVIRYDYDLDLCMLADQRQTLMGLTGAFKARGYTLRDANGTTKLVIRIRDDRTGYYADVYHYVVDGPILRSQFRPIEDVPAALVANRVEVPFLGGTVRVPKELEPLLTFRYGLDFMTPRRGDRGEGYTYNRVEAYTRMIENTCVGLYSILRSTFHR